MTTERLYYDDAYLVNFEARVVARGSRGERTTVALDRSAFYPEGGGQPGDRGSLNGVAVLDTQADNGMVWHVLAEPLAADEVRGVVDWARRFDFMQQHHGQHLLSAAAEQLLGAKTVAVHLGEESCTVDLDCAALSQEQAAALEERTNELIWADVSVTARFVTAEELGALALRKPPQAHERIRIVSAGDFDHSPCGGTHPRRTGEVGSVVIRRWERYKGGVRVEFVCGGRALRDYQSKNRLLGELAAQLRVGLPELTAAVERLRTAEETQRKSLEQATGRLLGYEAAEMVAEASRIGDVPVVVARFEDRSLEQLRGLGKQIVERGGVALLGTRASDSGQAQLVFTRAAAVSGDMGALLKAATAILGGRGGGRPEAAQGGGPNGGKLDEALEAAREGLTRGREA